MDRPIPKEVDVILDRTSPVPLYHQLAQAIEASISEGQLLPGDRLENELSLTSRLGLARPTARQAIQELTRKGLVVRKRGVGTLVLHPRISRDTKLTSLLDDLTKTGKKPSTRLLEFSEDIDEEIRASLLSSEPGGEFVKVRRLRSADGVPIAILTNYLPRRFDLTRESLENAGLYAVLRARGANLQVAHQLIQARLMTAEEADLLDETEPAACLIGERTVYDDAGRLVELGHHIYRASHYSMEVSLVP